MESTIFKYRVNIGKIFRSIWLFQFMLLESVNVQFCEQITLIQSKTTQVEFICYPYMYVKCFGLYLGHPQACQNKNHTKEDTFWLWNYNASLIYEYYWFCWDIYSWRKAINYIMKSKVPRIDPWGTPCFIIPQTEK
jgi:hypothetical protein